GEYLDSQNDSLESIQTELDEWLFNRYMGDITFLLAWNEIPFTGDQINKSFKEVNKQVREILEKKKNNKLKSILATDKHWNTDKFIFSKVYEDLQANGECAVQGYYAGDKHHLYENSKDKYLSKISHEERETGEDLPHNIYVHFESMKNADNLSLPFEMTFSLEQKSLNHHDFEIETFAPANLPKFTNRKSAKEFEELYCLSCNEYNKVEENIPKKCEILERFKLKGEYQPKSFHCLAQESKIVYKKPESEKESLKGESFLGIFKADLDNAGIYFQESSSIEDYHQRSKKVNDFFGKRLNDLIQNNEEYNSSIYTVFAGGDDLFLIGSYTKLLDFIQKLQEEFKKEFSDKLTFSAGFSLTKPRTPIQVGATKAEQELKSSKEYAIGTGENKKEKNAISIFGTTMSWTEYKEVLVYIREIIKFIESGLPVSFLYRLLHFYKENKRVANDPKAVIWKSHFAYAKRRNIWQNTLLFKGDKQDKIKTELDTLITNLLSEKKIYYANVVLQLAIYQSRGGK
ncbi:MAG TPA: hypothetical protein PLX69_22390, partial [Leptospiraceae bacterium]|nr:hypothetical protein [Leptospiraceae bacterium]